MGLKIKFLSIAVVMYALVIPRHSTVTDRWFDNDIGNYLTSSELCSALRCCVYECFRLMLLISISLKSAQSCLLSKRCMQASNAKDEPRNRKEVQGELRNARTSACETDAINIPSNEKHCTKRMRNLLRPGIARTVCLVSKDLLPWNLRQVCPCVTLKKGHYSKSQISTWQVNPHWHGVIVAAPHRHPGQRRRFWASAP